LVGENGIPSDLNEILYKHAIVTLDSRGRISIPPRFLEEMKLKSGDKILLRLETNQITLLRPNITRNTPI